MSKSVYTVLMASGGMSSRIALSLIFVSGAQWARFQLPVGGEEKEISPSQAFIFSQFNQRIPLLNNVEAYISFGESTHTLRVLSSYSSPLLSLELFSFYPLYFLLWVRQNIVFLFSLKSGNRFLIMLTAIYDMLHSASLWSSKNAFDRRFMRCIYLQCLRYIHQE